MLSNKIFLFRPYMKSIFAQLQRSITFPSPSEKKLLFRDADPYRHDDLALAWENEALSGGPEKVKPFYSY